MFLPDFLPAPDAARVRLHARFGVQTGSNGKPPAPRREEALRVLKWMFTAAIPSQRFLNLREFMRNQYILLTAAEERGGLYRRGDKFVVAQSVPPLGLVHCGRRSTDQTARIVSAIAVQHPFIRLIFSGSGSERSFGSKDQGINAAYAAAKSLDFDFIGILDGDIALSGAIYYETICAGSRQCAAPALRVVTSTSGPTGHGKCRRGNSEDSVPAACKCFGALLRADGRYIPMHHGGEDWLRRSGAHGRFGRFWLAPIFTSFISAPTSSAGGPMARSVPVGTDGCVVWLASGFEINQMLPPRRCASVWLEAWCDLRVSMAECFRTQTAHLSGAGRLPEKRTSRQNAEMLPSLAAETGVTVGTTSNVTKTEAVLAF